MQQTGVPDLLDLIARELNGREDAGRGPVDSLGEADRQFRHAAGMTGGGGVTTFDRGH